MKRTFKIPGRTPSLNTTLNMHWGERCKMKTDWWRKMVIVMGQTKPTGKMRVTFTSFRRNLLDSDNLVGGIKSIRDCLVKLGWLVDDSPQHCEFIYSQVQSKDEYLRIELEATSGKENRV